MLIANTASLIRFQKDDYIIEYIKDLYKEVRLLRLRYTEVKDITKANYNKEFNFISKKMKTIFKERFNLNFILRDSNTFAVIPLVNTREIDFNFSFKQNDFKVAIKQIKEFESFIKNNEIKIDLKKAKVYGVDNHIRFPLYINPDNLGTMDENEFTAIILHEIGHVITLLEMYSNTNKAIVSLSNGLIENNIPTETLNVLHIGGKITNEKDAMVKIYEELDKHILNIKLATNKNDSTDIEYEADDFVAKFGMAEYLPKALNKMMGVDKATYGKLAEIGFILSTLYILITYTMLSFVVNPVSAITITLLSLVVGTIYKLSKSAITQNKRNPVLDEHGSIGYRYTKIRLSVIHILRVEHLTKSEQREILHQLDVIDEEIKVLENSFMDSVLGSILHPLLNSNVNIQDSLAITIESLIENDLYVSKARFVAGTNGFKYQGRKDPIVKELTNFYKKVTSNSVIGNTVEIKNILAEIDDLIYERFGIPIMTMPAALFNIGFACIPFTMVNQTSLSGMNYHMNNRLSIYNFITQDSSYKFIEDIVNGKKVRIDYVNNRVIGLDKKRHKSLLFIEFGRDILYRTYNDSSIALTPEELTHITLHEVGHLITHLRALINTVRTNHRLQDDLLEYNNSITDTAVIENDERFEKEYENFSGLTGTIVSSIKAYVLYYKSLVLTTLGLDNLEISVDVLLDHKGFRDSLGTYNTYRTDSEVVADNFAAMFGGGDYIASGIRRIMTMNLENKLFIMVPTIIAITASLINTLVQMGKLTKLPILVVRVLKLTMYSWMTFYIARLIFNNTFSYDKLPERIDKIKRSLISKLRTQDLNKTEVKEIINTIDNLDKEYKIILKSGYGSDLLSIFVPNHNVGKEYKPDKRLIDILEKSINNDLHVYKYRLESIQPSLASNDSGIKYVTEFYIDKEYIIWTELLDKKLDVINSNLNKVGIDISIDDSDDEIIIVTSDYKLKVRNGVSTIAFIPINDITRDVINLTTESFKMLWHLYNPNIEVYDIIPITLNKYKTLYIETMKLYNFSDSKKVREVTRKISEIRNNLRKDYGIFTPFDYIDNILKVNDLKTKLGNEFKLLKEFIQILEKEYGVDPRALYLDLHSGNIVINDSKYILLDPIYYSVSNASKQDNYIKIDRQLLSEKVIKATASSAKDLIYKDELSKVYHYGIKGFKYLKPAFLIKDKTTVSDPDSKNISLFIGELTQEHIDKLRDSGFKLYNNIEMEYIVDVVDNKDKIIKIQLYSTPEEMKYHDIYWDNFYKKNSRKTNFKELKQQYRDIMHKKIYGKEYFTPDEYIEYIENTDYKDIDKYVDINIEKGNKHQYASLIPHIQITTENVIDVEDTIYIK